MIDDHPDDSGDVDGATARSGPGHEDPKPNDMAEAGPMGWNGSGGTDRPGREPRPIIERLGLAGVAAVLAALFGGVGLAAWSGDEPFLAVMGGIGCVMTGWVGGLTLFRG